MGKRTVGLFCGFIAMCAVLIGRITALGMEEDYINAAQSHSSYSLTLAETRGKIYDRSGNALAGGSYRYKAVIIPSAQTSAELFNYLSAEELEKISDKLKGTFPFATDVPNGGCESDGITVYRVPERYSDNGMATHLVGYCGENGGESGIECAYDEWLSSASGKLTVTCRINAAGRSLDAAKQEISDTTGNSDRGVMLTIDSHIQNIAETAAAKYIDCGAVVVMDVKSGEILAMASLPDYNRNDIAAVLNDENTPLINRALSAYNAGSVFKTVIAAAALESGIDPLAEYECTGQVKIGINTMGCINRTAHKNVNMHSAIAHSCNTYFINTAANTGAENILSMAESLGFGKSTQLASNYKGATGTLPSAESLKNPAALANFSFGQGTLTVTPVQIAAMFAAIARGGEYIEPSVVIGLTDEDLNIISTQKKAVSHTSMSSETAQILGECLRTAVLEGTAKAGASDKVTSAAKTGTAETGIFKNNKAVNQAWYAGYFPYEDPRYVCVVLAESGASGGASAGPVFKEIAERIYASIA